MATYRPGRASDAGALADLHLDAHASGMALGLLGPLDRDRLADTYRELVERLDGRERVLLVAEQDGVVVGMAQLAFSGADNAAHRAEVQRVAVSSRVRGSGVGTGLMRAVEDAAREHGVTLLWLTTHAESDACAFYAAVGYTQLGVMPEYSRRPDGALADGAFFYRQL